MAHIEKVALVTASSAGLGAAVVKSLAMSGYRVVINYNSREAKAQEVAQTCEKIRPSEGPSRYHVVKADASSRADIKNLVATTIDTFGRLDAVVSNSGYTRMAEFMNLEDGIREEDWDDCFNANVKAHLWLFHAAKPHLQANPEGGNFVTIASTAGVRVSGSSLPYAVSKAAQIYLAKCLAVICGQAKIRVNSVSPGLMLTEWGQRFTPEKQEDHRQKTARKEIISVEDVAEAVKLVCESKSVTGQNYIVDSGFSIA